jgi:hypothetical protein
MTPPLSISIRQKRCERADDASWMWFFARLEMNTRAAMRCMHIFGSAFCDQQPVTSQYGDYIRIQVVPKEKLSIGTMRRQLSCVCKIVNIAYNFLPEECRKHLLQLMLY